MASRRVFGEILGSAVGSVWTTRLQVAASGVHRPNVAGISGNGAEGADSVVISGGYEDDEDYGTEVIYTGAGGNNPGTNRQVRDQDLSQSGIAGLITSQLEGLPIRVIRGAVRGSRFGPPSGYRYDGLFRVADHWAETGRSGFRIWRFKLVELAANEMVPYVRPTQPGMQPQQLPPAGNLEPDTTEGVTTRIVRSTRVSNWLKALYRGQCQVCGVRLIVPGGVAVEGAHIQALGRPHNGPDVPENVLSLCPNHHKMLDLGGIVITDGLGVVDFTGVEPGTLQVAPRHSVSLDRVRYHRSLWGV